MTSHTYAKVSMVSTLFATAVHHQAELSVIATLVAIVAGLVSIYRGLRGK